MPPNVPKIFTRGIRVPAGPLEGTLALPCPCGDPVEFGGERDLYLTKNRDGYLVFYHEGCIVNPGGPEDA